MSSTQYFNSEVKILSQVAPNKNLSPQEKEKQIVLSDFESKVFAAKADAYNFIQNSIFYNDDNDCSYSIASSNHTPKRFLGQHFVAIILIENPGQMDCQNLHVNFVYEKETSSTSEEYLRNFKIPYLMKKACIVFPLCIYLTQQSYKWTLDPLTLDSRPGSPTPMSEASCPISSTKSPTRSPRAFRSSSDTASWTTTSSTRTRACRTSPSKTSPT